MKNLELNQMEVLQGGTEASCYWALAGIMLWGLAVCAAPVTGGGSIALVSLAGAINIGGMITSC